MNPEVNTHEAPVNAKKLAFINGLIWAFISLVIFLVSYYAAPGIFGNYSYSIVVLLISLGLAIFLTLDLRKKVGGYWTFKEALSNIFIMFFVQHLIYALFVLMFGKFIEPDYVNQMRDISLNTTVEMAETFGGGNQEVIDQMIEEGEKNIEKSLNPTFGEFMQSLGISVIMYFVGALIFAAIFKRQRPVFAPIVDED